MYCHLYTKYLIMTYKYTRPELPTIKDKEANLGGSQSRHTNGSFCTGANFSNMAFVTDFAKLS